jgi:hypothetical protein
MQDARQGIVERRENDCQGEGRPARIAAIGHIKHSFNFCSKQKPKQT